MKSSCLNTSTFETPPLVATPSKLVPGKASKSKNIKKANCNPVLEEVKENTQNKAAVAVKK